MTKQEAIAHVEQVLQEVPAISYVINRSVDAGDAGSEQAFSFDVTLDQLQSELVVVCDDVNFSGKWLVEVSEDVYRVLSHESIWMTLYLDARVVEVSI